MHPYNLMKQLIEPVFKKSGHREIVEELHPDIFGSAYSVFDNDNCKIRLVWDGKDGCGFAQTFDGDTRDKWQDIPCYLTEGDLESVPQNQEKIKLFRIAVENIAV